MVLFMLSKAVGRVMLAAGSGAVDGSLQSLQLRHF